MKKLLFLFALLVSVASMDAQTSKKKNSFVGSIGYQTEFQRFGLQMQGRYNLCHNFRLAPDVTFFFPKNQVSGLDINLNLHYVLTAKKLSFYPLAGIGLQTNFYGADRIVNDGGDLYIVNDTGSDFAFNLGGGLSYPLSSKCYLNAESKFMIGSKHNLTFMIGIGHSF